MKVLVLGSGGREHALAWKLKQSPSCQAIWLHPGNAGTRQMGIPALDATKDTGIEPLVKQAQGMQISLVVIGPETMLTAGYADAFRKAGIPVLGPDAAAAQLEGSKQFAKDFMLRANIPTAEYFVVHSEEQFRSKCTWQLPYVLKYDGLAAGKGVVVAQRDADVESFCERTWRKQEFGSKNQTVVVERCLGGREISYIGLCDGSTFYPFSSSTDYKRAFDNDQGANTGGMGVVSPSPFFSPELEQKISVRIIRPFLEQLKKERLPYRGALFLGLMVSPQGDPFVLEFNTRFGDPETQALLPRLESDFLKLALATALGSLAAIEPPKWSKEHFVYVIGAAHGYPEKAKTGDQITGVAEAQELGAQVFFSGVKETGEGLVTAGGRVLGVGGRGGSVEQARQEAYRYLSRIQWQDMHFRRDIGL